MAWMTSAFGSHLARAIGLGAIAGTALGIAGFTHAQDKPAVAPNAITSGSVTPTPSTTSPKTLTTEAMQDRAAKARDLSHQYKERLTAGIVTALKEGGPKGAIGACNTLAPELNNKLSEESTFEIARTAMKVRNPENTPDAWELKGLEAFQKEIALGSDPKKMEIYDVAVTSEGQSLFRYMRPIVMSEPCLICHGPSVTQELKSEIAQYYPDDKATGYNIGELRGAFSLIQQLD
jgi:hypothetical protein